MQQQQSPEIVTKAGEVIGPDTNATDNTNNNNNKKFFKNTEKGGKDNNKTR